MKLFANTVPYRSISQFYINLHFKWQGHRKLVLNSNYRTKSTYHTYGTYEHRDTFWYITCFKRNFDRKSQYIIIKSTKVQIKSEKSSTNIFDLMPPFFAGICNLSKTVFEEPLNISSSSAYLRPKTGHIQYSTW